MVVGQFADAQTARTTATSCPFPEADTHVSAVVDRLVDLASSDELCGEVAERGTERADPREAPGL